MKSGVKKLKKLCKKGLVKLAPVWKKVWMTLLNVDEEKAKDKMIVMERTGAGLRLAVAIGMLWSLWSFNWFFGLIGAAWLWISFQYYRSVYGFIKEVPK